MGALRTLAAAGLLSGVPAVTLAGPGTDIDRARLFADCAGRLSALAEHRYLFDGPAAERAERQRDAHADLLAAVLPDSGIPPRRAMGWRVSAKAAQAALLSEAAFGPSPARRSRAAKVADRYISACTRLLPGA